MKKGFFSLGCRFAILLCVFSCFRFSAEGQIITTIAGDGSIGYVTYSGDGGAATAAGLGAPVKCVFDSYGNCYISERDNNVIRKVNTSGIITTIAGTPGYFGGYSGDGGPATSAEFNHPFGIAIDATGNMYIADLNNYRIRKIDTSGTMSTFAGTGYGGFSGDGGPATAADFVSPIAVAIDAIGNLYIADYQSHRIRKIDTSGIISTVAGSGSIPGYSGDGGPATAAQLSYPNAVTLDAGGNIFIADNQNQCIRKVTPSGIITTVVGNGTAGYSGDGGPATAAQLNYPSSVSFDEHGNMAIADGANNCVRLVDTFGIIRTIAGNVTCGFSGDGGLATAATMCWPSDIITDASGNFIVIDHSNHCVRKIEMCMPVVAPITGPGHVCAGAVITLSDTTTGGTWSCADTSIASVSGSGPVYGISGGVVAISYTATNYCGSSYSVHTVTVDTIPAAGPVAGLDSICPGNTTALSAATSGGTWLSSNSSLATISSTGTVTGIASGTVTISYIVTNICGSDTATYAFTVKNIADCPSGVSMQQVAVSSFEVFPNPNSGTFTIRLSSLNNEVAQISITNIIGQKVKQLSLVTNKTQDVKLEVPAGVYFITAVTNSERITGKVVVQ